MKTIIIVSSILFFSIVLLVACQPSAKKPLTMDEMVLEKAEEYLKDKLNDPDSYEFVGLILIDSVLYKDNIECRRNIFKDRDNKVLVAKIDSLEKAMGDMVNDVASYTYLFSFRSNNAMGAMVLDEYYLQTGAGPNYEVLKLAGDWDETLLTPNVFPGYNEMIRKHLNK